MTLGLDFDLENVKSIEFGIGIENKKGSRFVAVPVGEEVQTALKEIATETWVALGKVEGGPARYEPSEIHESIEYRFLPIEDNLSTSIRQLHEALNLAIDSTGLSKPDSFFCYFTRMIDKGGRQLTALRRSTQFKGILSSRKRLMRLIDDSLTIIHDDVFKLDNDFDLLVDSNYIHILRPSGFEFAGKIKQAILAAVPKNIAQLEHDLPFIQFGGISKYAGKHSRAARYLASICAQSGSQNVDKALLRSFCAQNDVNVIVSSGKLTVEEGHEMGFLEVLDRRRYEINLVKNSPERYRAASRKKIE